MFKDITQHFIDIKEKGHVARAYYIDSILYLSFNKELAYLWTNRFCYCVVTYERREKYKRHNKGEVDLL
jgi:hypothetical protein